MQWGTVAWLAVVWVFLWGHISVANVLAGVLVGLIVTLAFRMAPIDFHGRLHPWALVVLGVRFVIDLLRASAEVSWLALRPRYKPHGAVIGVQLRSHSDFYLTATAELVTLVPGSLVVEANRLTGRLYLHVLDLAYSGGAEAVRASVLAQEERVLRAFASHDEQVEAGVMPR